MARAVALAPYLAAHARAALGLFATARKTEGAAVLKAWLEAHPRREFTQREAHQGCRRHFDGPDEVADALDILEAYGYVQDAPGQVLRPGARGGRPKRRVLLTNPRWLPDPPDPPDPPATPDSDAPPAPVEDTGDAGGGFEDAGGSFEDGFEDGKNGSPLSGRGGFEYIEYAEYGPPGPHGGQGPPRSAPDAPARRAARAGGQPG